MIGVFRGNRLILASLLASGFTIRPVLAGNDSYTVDSYSAKVTMTSLGDRHPNVRTGAGVTIGAPGFGGFQGFFTASDADFAPRLYLDGIASYMSGMGAGVGPGLDPKNGAFDIRAKVGLARPREWVVKTGKLAFTKGGDATSSINSVMETPYAYVRTWALFGGIDLLEAHWFKKASTLPSDSKSALTPTVMAGIHYDRNTELYYDVEGHSGLRKHESFSVDGSVTYGITGPYSGLSFLIESRFMDLLFSHSYVAGEFGGITPVGRAVAGAASNIGIMDPIRIGITFGYNFDFERGHLAALDPECIQSGKSATECKK